MGNAFGVEEFPFFFDEEILAGVASSFQTKGRWKSGILRVPFSSQFRMSVRCRISWRTVVFELSAMRASRNLNSKGLQDRHLESETGAFQALWRIA